MNLQRGGPIPPPVGPGEWEILCGTREARTGWPELERQAPNNVARAHQVLRTDPAPATETERQHRLRGKRLGTGEYKGKVLPQWQYEVTGAGRIWYLVDADDHRVIVMHAGPAHPKATE
ncbi:hypothetical protein [Actinoplanes awajinensis]|uniref:Cytotoxic translational repressor of toxin-antitoxin stability system n=1 Tax=Actinoplanes awajinensis subsp. mycoplanecinus TaxID=135947 RepID=A0A101JFF8_9ACTN|nr:hypothetical protein [Actinoplanes awajinensis]KUL25878.1 hypothetical protein ADL15_39940 [Actinoplanes awajinensis subsp. mycoplanecinus]